MEVFIEPLGDDEERFLTTTNITKSNSCRSKWPL